MDLSPCLQSTSCQNKFKLPMKGGVGTPVGLINQVHTLARPQSSNGINK